VEFALYANRPNPFNPSTLIRFDVKEACRVELRVFDVRGREVMTLADRRYPPGRHEARFDASGLDSGVYLYRIRMGGYTAVRKMTVVR
jgi:hypothetical protein